MSSTETNTTPTSRDLLQPEFLNEYADSIGLTFDFDTEDFQFVPHPIPMEQLGFTEIGSHVNEGRFYRIEIDGEVPAGTHTTLWYMAGSSMKAESTIPTEGSFDVYVKHTVVNDSALSEAFGYEHVGKLGIPTVQCIYPPRPSLKMRDESGRRTTFVRPYVITLAEKGLIPLSRLSERLFQPNPELGGGSTFQSLMDHVTNMHSNWTIHGDSFLRNWGYKREGNTAQILAMDLDSVIDFSQLMSGNQTDTSFFKQFPHAEQMADGILEEREIFYNGIMRDLGKIADQFDFETLPASDKAELDRVLGVYINNLIQQAVIEPELEARIRKEFSKDRFEE